MRKSFPFNLISAELADLHAYLMILSIEMESAQASNLAASNWTQTN